MIHERTYLIDLTLLCVGVWDDVTECKDELSFIHDEMKELLKEKIMLDGKLDAQVL